jgi:hypothetical protein
VESLEVDSRTGLLEEGRLALEDAFPSSLGEEGHPYQEEALAFSSYLEEAFPSLVEGRTNLAVANLVFSSMVLAQEHHSP